MTSNSQVRFLVLAALCGATLLIAMATRAPADQLFASLLLRFQQPLENRFARAVIKPGDEITGIVVLGGHTARVEEAVKIASRFPTARIVVTGAGDREEALIASEGYGAERLVMERRAGSTFENALFSKPIANPKPGERWLIVTSALHMPRAVGAFRAVGFAVEPWPVFDAHESKRHVVPNVRHELIGLVTYRVLGRSGELFPSPARILPLRGARKPA